MFVDSLLAVFRVSGAFCSVVTENNINDAFCLNNKRASGGVIIYVRESFLKPNSNLLLFNDNDDIINLTKLIQSFLIAYMYICICYNAPQGTSRQSSG